MAVVAMAIAFSTFAFKATEAKKTTLEWFRISQNYPLGTAVLPADATHMGSGTTPPSTDNCSEPDNYQCISGFNPIDVDASNNLKGPRKPVETAVERSAE